VDIIIILIICILHFFGKHSKHFNILSHKEFILILLFSFTLNLYAQKNPDSYPFIEGEEITYDAVYNWGFIWINAGKVSFNVSKTQINNKQTYQFIAKGKNLASYDWIYKVRDIFQSYTILDNLSPLYFERQTLEGKYQVHNKYKFDYTDSLIFLQTENTKKPYTKDTLTLLPNTYDVLSGIYFTRSIDFSQCNINETIPVRMIIDNEIFNLYIRYLGKEIIKTRDDRIFRTIKFSALLVEGTIFKGGEDLFVWVTDDKNKIPVLVEAKILMGSIKAILTETKNLKHPIEAEIYN
jgi:hypothetical protein